MAYKDKALQRLTTKERVRRYRNKQGVTTGNSPKAGADLSIIADDTDSHPLSIRLSNKCSISWRQFQQAMINANEGYYNFTPLSQRSIIDKEHLKKLYDTRYTKPTKQELDKYPLIEENKRGL